VSVIKPTKLEFNDSLKKMQQVFSNNNTQSFKTQDTCSNIGDNEDLIIQQQKEFIQLSKNLQETYLENYNLSNVNNSVEEELEKPIVANDLTSKKDHKIKTKLQIREDNNENKQL